MGFGLEDREVGAAEREGLLCTDITHSKRECINLLRVLFCMDMVVMVVLEDILRICIN